MRSRSQKAREAISSRNSLARSQRNLRGKRALLESLGGWRGPFNAEEQRQAQSSGPRKDCGGMGWETWEECPHEWGRPRGHPSLKGCSTRSEEHTSELQSLRHL